MKAWRILRMPLAACCAVLLYGALAFGQGHGPAYGLSTPTLARGGWSLDVPLMSRVVADKRVLMMRPMVSYGITEDVQLSLSLPVPLYVEQGVPPAHAMARMPTSRDAELLMAWRFQRKATAVGSRFETTSYIGLDYPTDARRNGIETHPGVYGALVPGYASRPVYAWVGGLYRRYLSPIGPVNDHLGDVVMYSAVLGYRPPAFQHDYPKPDWRVFVEAIGEHADRDVAAGNERPNSGGHQIFLAPTVLGLYGSWGISGGPAFPVYRRINGTQPREKLRFIVNTTFWF
ncbi:MAG: hypothetical protein ACT4O1_11160 [Gemmatimonadota bacterium]